MTRKIRKTKAFDLTLDVKDDTFIAPPAAGQRHWRCWIRRRPFPPCKGRWRNPCSRPAASNNRAP